MSTLNIRQRKAEPADLTVMRAFATILPKLKRHEALAAARWMFEVANDPKTRTLDGAVIERRES